MDDLPDALDRFAARLETLERRVYTLEHPGKVSTGELALEAKPAVAAQPADAPGVALAGGAFATVGKAMLGISGAICCEPLRSRRRFQSWGSRRLRLHTRCCGWFGLRVRPPGHGSPAPRMHARPR